MMLINSSKVKRFRMCTDGLIAVYRKDTPEECILVKSPIKVKLDKDMLVLLYLTKNDKGTSVWSVSILNSTRRKFNQDYVYEVWRKQFYYNDYRSDIWPKDGIIIEEGHKK